MKIAVIGTGYVGLVSGTCFAEWGHTVICVDKNTRKIADLHQGRMPIYEPHLDEMVERNYAAGRLDFTCNLNSAVTGAAIVFIVVATPPRIDRVETDLSCIYLAACELAPLITDDTVVVLKSTVPVGTGDVVQKIIGAVRKPGTFSVASNPEFLREGLAVCDFLAPDRVVIGVDDERACKRLLELYDVPMGLQETPILVTTRRTAELIKYAANAFLATKITFINELADLCEQVGSDVEELALGMGLDRRIGTTFLAPGPGFGGSCFPKDTQALLRTAQDYGVELRIVEETIIANDARKRRMALKVMEALGGSIDGRTIAILGLTFKPDTDDMREAPSVRLIEALQRFGGHIRAYDPVGIENAASMLDHVVFCDDPYECVRDADAAVVMTEWAIIKNLDLAQLKNNMRQPILVDLRNALQVEAALQLGFRISTIGRPACAEGDLQSMMRLRNKSLRTAKASSAVTRERENGTIR